MATNVTVAGGKGVVWTLPFGATANAALAQTLANSITTLVNDGTATTFINKGQTGGMIPPVPPATSASLSRSPPAW